MQLCTLRTHSAHKFNMKFQSFLSSRTQKCAQDSFPSPAVRTHPHTFRAHLRISLSRLCQRRFVRALLVAPQPRGHAFLLRYP